MFRNPRFVIATALVGALGGSGAWWASSSPIPESAHGYIVVFQPGTPVSATANRLANAHGVSKRHEFDFAVEGFSFDGSATAAAAIAGDSAVAYVEPNGIVTFAAPKFCADDPTHPGCGGTDGGGDPPPPPDNTQTTPWGVARVGGPLGPSGGSAWIIDSGIDLDHPDLNVDTARSVNFVRKGKDSADDKNGHGTHVAGTIAAVDNTFGVVGVSSGDSVVAVRVLDAQGYGYTDGVIAGVDYVAANAAPGDVANLSLGMSGHVESLHQAILNLADQGVRVAIAAGNEGDDAAVHEPAHVEHQNVWTVSAIDSTDCMPYWSNWGNPPVDFAAPGVDIDSTYKGAVYAQMSGTSMASPHVAGLLLHGVPVANGEACDDTDGAADPIAHH